jgi:transposase
LVREQASHIQRIQKTLEDANLKLGSVLSQIMGKSGRAIIEALIGGECDPDALLALVQRGVKARPEKLRAALRGRVTDRHRLLLQLHLRHVDALAATVAEIDAEVDRDLHPFRQAIRLLPTIPGVSDLTALVIISEIGTDMSRFPTAGHLISWAGLCPRSDESAGKRRSTRLRNGEASHEFVIALATPEFGKFRATVIVQQRQSATQFRPSPGRDFYHSGRICEQRGRDCGTNGQAAMKPALSAS